MEIRSTHESGRDASIRWLQTKIYILRILGNDCKSAAFRPILQNFYLESGDNTEDILGPSWKLSKQQHIRNIRLDIHPGLSGRTDLIISIGATIYFSYNTQSDCKEHLDEV